MEIKNNYYESPEKIWARRNQEDPWVMYMIVRDSLGMSAGKIGAQCGHAVGMIYNHYNEICVEHKSSKLIASFKEWQNTSFRKVVLRAKENQWERLKSKLDLFVLVRDAGLTEVSPNSETVIGIWPIKKSERPNCLRKLQALK